MKFKQDLDRDITLVRAALSHQLFSVAEELGWTDRDLWKYVEWIGKQPSDYTDKIVTMLSELDKVEMVYDNT